MMTLNRTESDTIVSIVNNAENSNVSEFDGQSPYSNESTSSMTQHHVQLMSANILSTTLATTPFTITTPMGVTTHSIVASWMDWLSSGRVQIPLYATILLLAITGNTLVILTLIQNRRMRTITNVFLLNLAVSDILLGVLCMPFTLVGTLLRDFVFGEIMCKFLPYLQGKPLLTLHFLLSLHIILFGRFYSRDFRYFH